MSTSTRPLDLPILGMSNIIPGVFISSLGEVCSNKTVNDRGIKCVISFVEVPKKVEGIEYFVYPIRDNLGQVISDLFDSICELINSNLERGGVCINCRLGISRSSSFVAAYLMRKRRLSADRAIQFICERHSRADPNPNFRSQLYEFERRIALEEFCGDIWRNFGEYKVVPTTDLPLSIRERVVLIAKLSKSPKNRTKKDSPKKKKRRKSWSDSDDEVECNLRFEEQESSRSPFRSKSDSDTDSDEQSSSIARSESQEPSKWDFNQVSNGVIISDWNKLCHGKLKILSVTHSIKKEVDEFEEREGEEDDDDDRSKSTSTKNEERIVIVIFGQRNDGNITPLKSGFLSNFIRQHITSKCERTGTYLFDHKNTTGAIIISKNLDLFSHNNEQLKTTKKKSAETLVSFEIIVDKSKFKEINLKYFPTLKEALPIRLATSEVVKDLQRQEEIRLIGFPGDFEHEIMKKRYMTNNINVKRSIFGAMGFCYPSLYNETNEEKYYEKLDEFNERTQRKIEEKDAKDSFICSILKIMSIQRKRMNYDSEFLGVSRGTILKVNQEEDFVIHSCVSCRGSSGSLVVNTQNEVIGVLVGGDSENYVFSKIRKEFL